MNRFLSYNSIRCVNCPSEKDPIFRKETKLPDLLSIPKFSLNSIGNPIPKWMFNFYDMAAILSLIRTNPYSSQPSKWRVQKYTSEIEWNNLKEFTITIQSLDWNKNNESAHFVLHVLHCVFLLMGLYFM